MVVQQEGVALFAISLDARAGISGLQPLHEILGNAVVAERSLGGTLSLGSLAGGDQEQIERFARMTGFPLLDVDQFSLEKTCDFGLELRRLLDKGGRKAVSEEAWKVVEDYLRSHNTCTLCSGWGSACERHTWNTGSRTDISSSSVRVGRNSPTCSSPESIASCL
jgi:hypothetical protein